MSTVFDVPCPECGQHMSVGSGGDLECAACQHSYHARMGHLFLVAEPGSAKVVVSEGGPGRHRTGRPTATAP